VFLWVEHRARRSENGFGQAKRIRQNARTCRRPAGVDVLEKNPMGDRELQVRECAYYFWEAEGRPEGRAQMHWTMAEIATTLFSYLNAPANKHPMSNGGVESVGEETVSPGVWQN
jgi:hypothetical protein